jgi:putative membrane protein
MRSRRILISKRPTHKKGLFLMNRKTSTLLSLGISAVLIAAAIWFLYNHNAGRWTGNGRWGMGYDHMMGGGMGIVMIIFWIVLIGALILLVSGAINGIRAFQKKEGEMQTPLEILKQRYARGEIDRAEYEDKRRNLST